MTGAARWWRRRSLRARLTAAAVGVIVVAITLSAVLLTVRLRSALIAAVDETTLHRSEAVAAAVSAGRPLSSVLVEDDDQIVQVVDSDGGVLASSLDPLPRGSLLVPPASSALTVRTQNGVALPGEQDEPYRVVTRPVETPQGQRLFVQVALPLDDAQESVAELSAALVVGVPAVIAVLAAMTWVLAGRALRPVEALRRQAAAIPGEALERRLAVPESGDELARLAQTFNALLARVEAATQRQREFLADAAHEIRSPLASLRTQLEVASIQRRHDRAWRESLPALIEDAQRLSRLVDDLLRLARLDAHRPLARRPVDLDEIALDAARRLRGRTQLAVDTSGVSAARVLGDADALARVTQNLLDNATRHARSRISITLGGNGCATLTVGDDGEGVPPEQREQVFERFARLDDARSRDAGGTGLGLAIVRAVVNEHGGDVRIEDAQPGARVVVQLPLAE